MKKFFLLMLVAVTMLLSSNSYALTTFWQNGVALDNVGQIVDNAAVSVRVTIYDAGGSQLYQQTFAGVATSQFAVFQVEVDGSADALGFAAINADAGTMIKVETDAGSGYVLSSIQSMSYAQYNTTVVPGQIELTEHHIIMGDASNNGEDLPVGGEMTATNTGAVASFIINNDAITNAKMADNAIGNAEMRDDAIGTVEIQDDAVTAAKINSDVAGAGMVQNGGTGALDVHNTDGSITVTADDITLNVGHANTWTVDQTFENILPAANNTYDLGSDALRWNDLWVSGASVHIGTAAATEMLLGYASNTGTITIDGAAHPAVEITNTGFIGFDTDINGINNFQFYSDRLQMTTGVGADLYLDETGLRRLGPGPAEFTFETTAGGALNITFANGSDIAVTGDAVVTGTFGFDGATPQVDEIVTVVDDVDNTALPTEGAVYNLTTTMKGYPYVTVGNVADLTAERAIATDATLTATDGGANGSYTLGIDLTHANTWTATQTFDDIVINDATVSGTNNLVLDGDSPAAAGDISGSYTAGLTIDNDAVTSAKIADGEIVDADVSGTAEIAVSKLANGTAGQILTTDGTNVSWGDVSGVMADLTFGNGLATYNDTYDGSAAKTVSVLLNGTTLLNDGAGAGISLNLGNANTWTATQTFDDIVINDATVTGTNNLVLDADLAAWTGSTNITTLGTITTGTWQGTAIADAYIPNDITIDLATTATNLAGGVAGSVPYQTGASTTGFLGIGAANTIMTSTGVAPQWVSSLTDAQVANALTIDGGTVTNSNITPGTATVEANAITDGTIVNADVNASAEIAVSKLANGTAGQILTTDGTNVSWGSEVDGVIGNEVTNATDATLTRSGVGTSGNPYTLAINLGNANTWTATQTFSQVDINSGTIDGTTIGGTTPAAGTFTDLSVNNNVLTSLIPDATSRNLGSDANRWGSLYLTGASIHLGSSGNETVIGYDGSLLTMDKTIYMSNGTGNLLIYEGTVDPNQITFVIPDPIADHTLTFPNITGTILTDNTIVTTGDVQGAYNGGFTIQTGVVNSSKIADGAIVDADVSGTAEIAVSKLANGTVGQILTTDGTNVSWGSEGDGVIGNEVTNVTNATLTRSGGGTSGDPYTLAINLGNANTWTVTQTFNQVDINSGDIDGTAIGGTVPAAGAFTTLSSSGNTTVTGALTANGITVGGIQAVTGGATTVTETIIQLGTMTANVTLNAGTTGQIVYVIGGTNGTYTFEAITFTYGATFIYSGTAWVAVSVH